MIKLNLSQQTYYIRLFLRFLWYLLVFTIFHTMIAYIFGYNFFTYTVLSIVFSFLINTALPIKNSYPFLRHGLILGCIIVIQSYIAENIFILREFYTPDTIWIILIFMSFILGIFHSIGRIGNGYLSNKIRSLFGYILIVLLVVAFIKYWWEGGVIYLVFRFFLTFGEVVIANLIFLIIHRLNESRSTIDTDS